MGAEHTYNSQHDITNFNYLLADQKVLLKSLNSTLVDDQLNQQAKRRALIIFNTVSFSQNVRSIMSEAKRDDEVLGVWEIKNGQIIAEGFGTPQQMLEHTKLHNPDAYNEQEAQTILSGFQLLLTGEAETVMYPMFHTDGTRYVPGLKRVGNTIVNVSVDVGKVIGRDLTLTEGADVLRMMHNNHVEDSTLTRDGQFPLLALKKTITTQEVQQTAVSRSLFSVDNQEFRDVSLFRKKVQQPPQVETAKVLIRLNISQEVSDNLTSLSDIKKKRDIQIETAAQPLKKIITSPKPVYSEFPDSAFISPVKEVTVIPAVPIKVPFKNEPKERRSKNIPTELTVTPKVEIIEPKHGMSTVVHGSPIATVEIKPIEQSLRPLQLVQEQKQPKYLDVKRNIIAQTLSSSEISIGNSLQLPRMGESKLMKTLFTGKAESKPRVNKPVLIYQENRLQTSREHSVQREKQKSFIPTIGSHSESVRRRWKEKIVAFFKLEPLNVSYSLRYKNKEEKPPQAAKITVSPQEHFPHLIRRGIKDVKRKVQDVSSPVRLRFLKINDFIASEFIKRRKLEAPQKKRVFFQETRRRVKNSFKRQLERVVNTTKQRQDQERHLNPITETVKKIAQLRIKKSLVYFKRVDEMRLQMEKVFQIIGVKQKNMQRNIPEKQPTISPIESKKTLLYRKTRMIVMNAKKDLKIIVERFVNSKSMLERSPILGKELVKRKFVTEGIIRSIHRAQVKITEKVIPLFKITREVKDKKKNQKTHSKNLYPVPDKRGTVGIRTFTETLVSIHFFLKSFQRRQTSLREDDKLNALGSTEHLQILNRFYIKQNDERKYQQKIIKLKDIFSVTVKKCLFNVLFLSKKAVFSYFAKEIDFKKEKNKNFQIRSYKAYFMFFFTNKRLQGEIPNAVIKTHSQLSSQRKQKKGVIFQRVFSLKQGTVFVA